MLDMPISASRQAGIYVRRAREEMGITRSELATSAGVSERLVASLELGDAKGIRLDKLLSIYGAVGLGLRIEQKALGKETTDVATTAQPHPAPTSSYDDYLRRFLADYANISHQNWESDYGGNETAGDHPGRALRCCASK